MYLPVAFKVDAHRHTHMDVNATMAQPSDGKSELRVEERERTGNGH